MHSPLILLYTYYGVCPGISCFAYPVSTIRFPHEQQIWLSPITPDSLHSCYIRSGIYPFLYSTDRNKESPAACFCVGQYRHEAVQPPSSTVWRLGLHRLLPVSAVVCLSAWLGMSGRVPGWHDHMASDQGVGSITAIHYFCWAAQTLLQYVIYLPLLLARGCKQTEMIIPVCWSVGHQCD